MKVLLTHELFAPDFRGGGEYVALETARGLMQKGVQVQVLTTGDPSVTSFEGIPTARLPVSRYRLNFLSDAIAEMAREYDLIHTFTYHACLPAERAARRLGKPVVCTVLGLFQHAWKDLRGPLAGRAWMALERYLLTRPYTKILFLSEYSRQQGIALGVMESRSGTNSPGIDWIDSTPLAEKENVVLFAGKFEARKGIDDVLAVAAALPKVRFQVAGWGPEEARLKREAPPNMQLLSFRPGTPLRSAFSKASIFLLPSRAETFGVAIVEAMAAGCAVVSTVPLGYQGAVVRPGDVRTISETVERLWSDREGTRELGRQNRELAGFFTWERYTNSLLETYREILSRPGAKIE